MQALHALLFWGFLCISVIEGCQENNINYKGNELRSCIPNILTWRKCSEECRKTENCRGWTWFTDNYEIEGKRKHCCLKTTDAGRQYETAAISGSVECGQYGLTLQELRFQNGRAESSSQFSPGSQYDPTNAFSEDFNRAWVSGRNKAGMGSTFPHLIWYRFPRAVVPGQVSFKPSPRRGNTDNGFLGATKYQFIGSNDQRCDQFSRWTVLCEDMIGDRFKYRTQSKYCQVKMERREPFRCLGINIMEAAVEDIGSVEISGIRMWKMT